MQFPAHPMALEFSPIYFPLWMEGNVTLSFRRVARALELRILEHCL